MKHLIFLLLSIPCMAWAGDLAPAAEQEISHLMDYLKNSGCQFNRNGTWYRPGEAADHLNQKYQYLLKKGLVASSEEFIARAGSQSSMSGKPYQVKCGADAPVHSGPWLQAELAKFRSQKP